MGRIPRLRPVDICQRKTVDFKVQRCVAAKAGPLARVDSLEKTPASHCAESASLECGEAAGEPSAAPRAHKKARADRAGLVALIGGFDRRVTKSISAALPAVLTKSALQCRLRKLHSPENALSSTRHRIS